MCDKIKKIEELTLHMTKCVAFTELLVAALDVSKEGLAILDEDGKYIFLNKAHEEMFGYDEGELEGQSWRVLYTEGQVKWFQENAFVDLKENGWWSGEKTAIHKDGSKVNQKVYLTALPNGGLVCTCIKMN